MSFLLTVLYFVYYAWGGRKGDDGEEEERTDSSKRQHETTATKRTPTKSWPYIHTIIIIIIQLRYPVWPGGMCSTPLHPSSTKSLTDFN